MWTLVQLGDGDLYLLLSLSPVCDVPRSTIIVMALPFSYIRPAKLRDLSRGGLRKWSDLCTWAVWKVCAAIRQSTRNNSKMKLRGRVSVKVIGSLADNLENFYWKWEAGYKSTHPPPPTYIKCQIRKRLKVWRQGTCNHPPKITLLKSLTIAILCERCYFIITSYL